MFLFMVIHRLEWWGSNSILCVKAARFVCWSLGDLEELGSGKQSKCYERLKSMLSCQRHTTAHMNGSSCGCAN